MRQSTLPLLLLAALTFFVGLGRGAITDTDEAFYAEAAREMVESGDWLTPHYNYEPRFQKPILYYWLAAATSLVLGPTELAARLWAALSGLGLVLVTAACARRWYDESVGLLAGAIVATNFGYFAMARAALPDLPLAFCITLAVFAAFAATLDQERTPRKWVLLSAVAMALGFLVKGPVGAAIPLLVIVPVVLIERRSLNVTAADFGLGTLVFAAIAAPWYLAMYMHHGSAYLEGFFLGDNFERFATDRFNDPRPWWFYLPIVAGGLMPWTPLASVWLSPVRQFLTRRRDIGTLDLRLLLWAALPLIFFTISVGKQPRYILSVLPPLAILLASSILERAREWRSLNGVRVRPLPDVAVILGAAGSGLLMAALGVLLYRGQPLLVNVATPFAIGASVAMGVAGLVVVLGALGGAWRIAPALVALGAAVTLTALQYGALSGSGEDTVQQMARHVQAERRAGEPVGTYQAFVRNLVFYTGARTVDVINDDQFADFLGSPSRVLAVVPVETLERFERARGITPLRLATLPYFNEAHARVGTLLWPDPARDLQQVVLVANR
ncbi:MAG: glycosyltransferase family 39 protein [Chloroflexi bacterium]|nr:glycosyltransferase family 39 protein [Chloroflexota bacterium]